jgi:uncharacterized protein YheU (UPF0270 family)
VIETQLEQENLIKENVDTKNIIESIELLEIDANLPKIVYINSKDGLRKRSEPSTSGDVTGLLLYGERVIIYEKSESSNVIDGIDEYWYRINQHRDKSKYEWIFGGYISENLPTDLPFILGLWDDINSPFVFGYLREGYRFHPNNEFSFFRKETGYGLMGSWEINDNIIRIFNLRPSDDYLAAHSSLNYSEENIQLKIIDNNNIVLFFSNNNKTVELRRSLDLWW